MNVFHELAYAIHWYHRGFYRTEIKKALKSKNKNFETDSHFGSDSLPI